MKNLVFDLRGNSGGYLNIAFDLADQFLPSGKLIVYTKGLRSPKQDFIATSGGTFETGKLVVLIDEGSASASEIVSGAVRTGIVALFWEGAHLAKVWFSGHICCPTVPWFASQRHVIILLRAGVFRNPMQMAKKIIGMKFLTVTNTVKYSCRQYQIP